MSSASAPLALAASRKLAHSELVNETHPHTSAHYGGAVAPGDGVVLHGRMLASWTFVRGGFRLICNVDGAVKFRDSWTWLTVAAHAHSGATSPDGEGWSALDGW